MKKVAVLSLAAVMVLSGCSNAAKNNEKADVQASSKQVKSTIFNGELEKNVELRVLENDTAIQQGYVKELLNAFNEEYKEYNIVAVDANIDQYTDLATYGPDGYGPDVLYGANDFIMRFVDGKHIYPIPVQNLECYSTIPQDAWDAYKVNVDGSTYYMGVPINVQAPILYYRKDLLPEDWKTTWDTNANDIPDMLENWNEMYRYSKWVHEQDSSKYGYMKSLYDTYFSSGFLFSYGGYIFGNNNTDTNDIGLGAGEAEKGAWVLQQLSSAMSEECIDDTITKNAYSKMGNGTYFATISTPDVYTLFIKELGLEYESQGMSKEEATALAKENLVQTKLPKLPSSGDLTDDQCDMIESKMMGGINGYAISSYTQYPNASLAFVEFAANYKNALLRNQYLGTIPARQDAAKEVGGISQMLFDELANGDIIPMPSLKEVKQIWAPCETFFSDLAKDNFRTEGKKYTSLEILKTELNNVSKKIHDTIYTLAE